MSRYEKEGQKNAAGDAFFWPSFSFPLDKKRIAGAILSFTHKKDRAKGGQKEKPGTRVPTAVPGSGVKETKPRTIIIQAQKGNVNYERDNENQQNRRIP